MDIGTHIRKVGFLVVLFLLPCLLFAQNSDTKSLHEILERIYDEMLPLCGNLIDMGRGIAGFASLWYIAARVWRHIANAEPIDVYPLLRPFAIGFCIMIFPLLLSLINGILQPTVSATAAMVKGSDDAIALLLKEKKKQIQQGGVILGTQDRERWFKYFDVNAEPSNENRLGSDLKFAMEKATFEFRYSVKLWMSEVLELVFEAAALCIDCLRTFQLILLSILGPFVFAISVFDGFQYSLNAWLARYINVYLWLPVANIFGSFIGRIQLLMLKRDLTQFSNGGSSLFNSTDTAYQIFLLIGIVGYFCVPSVANYIVHTAGAGAFQQRVSRVFSSIASQVITGIQLHKETTAATHNGTMGSYFGNRLKGNI